MENRIHPETTHKEGSYLWFTDQLRFMTVDEYNKEFGHSIDTMPSITMLHVYANGLHIEIHNHEEAGVPPYALLAVENRMYTTNKYSYNFLLRQLYDFYLSHQPKLDDFDKVAMIDMIEIMNLRYKNSHRYAGSNEELAHSNLLYGYAYKCGLWSDDDSDKYGRHDEEVRLEVLKERIYKY